MIEVVEVRAEDQAVHVRRLAWEFIDWLREVYPELIEGIDEYLAVQNFQSQLDDLLLHFGPPKGECLLALENGYPLGILMLKPRSESVCEMNRMFVRAEGRGKGVARALGDELVKRARKMGYERMELTALNRHFAAIALYESLGFEKYRGKNETNQSRESEVHMRLQL